MHLAFARALKKLFYGSPQFPPVSATMRLALAAVYTLDDTSQRVQTKLVNLLGQHPCCVHRIKIFDSCCNYFINRHAMVNSEHYFFFLDGWFFNNRTFASLLHVVFSSSRLAHFRCAASQRSTVSFAGKVLSSRNADRALDALKCGTQAQQKF